ncbi:hypothetical protein [Rhizobium sp. 768_B6_N1_8]|jgi:hypothetical protein|uniref:hypothetical protein n=1 Tax=unclassified Rhizobium TaxID=2613769 RepID=UPI003F225AF7
MSRVFELGCRSPKLSQEFVDRPLVQCPSPEHTCTFLTAEPDASELDSLGGRTSEAVFLELAGQKGAIAAWLACQFPHPLLKFNNTVRVIAITWS